MIEIAVLLVVFVIVLAFSLLDLALRVVGLRGGQNLSPHQLSRRRAAGAAFAGAFSVYVLETGGWPLDQLPSWASSALTVIAVVSALLVLAGVLGARERDPSEAVISLVLAGGGYALLRWQWYVPRHYFGADYVPADLINRLLPGVYIAAVAAGIARAVICLLPVGGQGQRNPYETARLSAVVAAFALVAAVYVLATGQWLGPSSARSPVMRRPLWRWSLCYRWWRFCGRSTARRNFKCGIGMASAFHWRSPPSLSWRCWADGRCRQVRRLNSPIACCRVFILRC